MLRRMRVWSFDLHETFRANCLITASRRVEIRRIIQEADGAFAGVFVQVHFDWLAIHKRIVRKL
jgi:hypothetical protein